MGGRGGGGGGEEKDNNKKGELSRSPAPLKRLHSAIARSDRS